jgi:hypothetical protein
MMSFVLTTTVIYGISGKGNNIKRHISNQEQKLKTLEHESEGSLSLNSDLQLILSVNREEGLGNPSLRV